MKIFLHIALRNLLRHKNRSSIALAAIVLSLGALIFLWSFTDGSHRQMIDNIKTMLTSDAQILPKQLDSLYSQSGIIEDPATIRGLLKNDPKIVAFAERVLGGGIMSTATESTSFKIIGLDPMQERAIGSRLPIKQGRMLQTEDKQGLLLGEPVFQRLDLQLGDKIVVTVQDYYGTFNGDVFRLIGTFETGNEQLDNGNLLILLSSAQQLLALDQQISAIAITIDPQYEIDDVVRELRSKMAGTGLSVLTWEDLTPLIAQMIRYNEGRNFILVLIVLTIVALGILNTLMMSVVDRTREFGLMMAIGTRPKQIIWMVTLESFLLTAFGSLLALGLGVGVTLYFGEVGIELVQFSKRFANLLIGPTVYPTIVWSHIAVSIAIIFIGNVLVSLYPAWRASRFDPIEAMRQVG